MFQLEPEIFLGVIASISTAVLAVITFFYMRETRLIRKAGQTPSFSIAPTLWTLGGKFHRLQLVNMGQAANSICVDCSWNNSSKNFYVLSLGFQGRANLDLPIDEIAKNGRELSVNIECKDARGDKYKQKLEIDFGESIAEKRTIVYQYDTFESIAHDLDDIKSELGNIGRELSKR